MRQHEQKEETVTMSKNTDSAISFKPGKRYHSLLSDKGRILHIHRTGPAKGEVHFDGPFWEKEFGAEKLSELLSKSYETRNLEGDVRIVRSKKKVK